ncbi:recombinase family protein [Sedimentibacter sp. MB31-C6]|uniref:recombinase family protein n=1 Tax=Sedimentibacter sp. MB31-C6 TaxID=3109366 RepID=UPI003FA6F373
MRLSKDDEGLSESSSISTQKKMLSSYAKENKFEVYDEYIDDGYSGTSFERPAFLRMIRDIEDKKVNLVITKDLSRLGRDYITTGQFTEIYFPEHGVRYIAINDGYDSESIYNDIVPFKNVLNEMYARDTSKKIRSAFQTKMKEGSYIGNFAPYGYKKDPNNNGHLIIDEEAASVVKEMFEMAEMGHKPTDIAKYLNEKGIMTPAMYRCSTRPYLDIDKYSKRKEWISVTVAKMLKNIVYLGHTAQGKTRKVSLKSNATIINPPEEWIIVKNTHEPIITQETYDIVRQRTIARTNKRKSNFKNIFSGIAKCADCGKNMSTAGTRKKGAVANLVCGGYKLYGSKECSNHFIDYETLYDIVLNELKKHICLTENEKKSILKELQDENDLSKDSNLKKNIKMLEEYRLRIKEIDSIIQRLYEDNVTGKISDSRFSNLLNSYEQQQHNILNKIEELENIERLKEDSQKEAYAKFFELIQDYTEIKELTPELLYKVIDYIEIGQGHYEKTDKGKVKKQSIKIYYRFIGNIEENKNSIN